MNFLLKLITMPVVGIFFWMFSAAAAPIPKERLGDYKAAVMIQLEKWAAVCSMETGEGIFGITLGQLVAGASRAELSSNGVQPLITFLFEENSTTQITTSVTTSMDFKSIVSVRVVRSTLETFKKNFGDLRNPRIEPVTEWIDKSVAVCK